MENAAEKLTYEQLSDKNSELKSLLDELQGKYDWLLEKYKIDVLRLYGRKRENRMVDGQTVFEGVFDEAESEADPAALEPAIGEIAEGAEPKKKKYQGQKADRLKGLPVEQVHYELAADEKKCVECGKPLPELAPTVTRRIEIEPAKVKVVENVRHTYGPCGCGQGQACQRPIVRAPMPEPAIPHSMASESAIAFVIAEKYQMGLPLYRLETMFRLQGAAVSRQTMANWVIKAVELWLCLIYGRIKESLLGRNIIMADETELQVLHEPGRPAEAKSYMWLYRSGRDGPPAVLFEYRPTREADNPRRFLEGFQGYLCVDGYKGYNGLPGVTVVSCFAHARRKFCDAFKIIPMANRDKPSAASEGLSYCDKLFEIERGLKDKTPGERHCARLEKSRPVLDSFKSWLDSKKGRVAPKSLIGVAVNYCLGYWDTLCNFMKDGRLEISNNKSERTIRHFVIGRNGWLFSNSQKGANASAVAYSIVETAFENGLVPYEYITHLLKTLPNADAKDSNVLDSLLPWSEAIPDRCRQSYYAPV